MGHSLRFFFEIRDLNFLCRKWTLLWGFNKDLDFKTSLTPRETHMVRKSGGARPRGAGVVMGRGHWVSRGGIHGFFLPPAALAVMVATFGSVFLKIVRKMAEGPRGRKNPPWILVPEKTRENTQKISDSNGRA